jgi:hypothetical protein
VQLGMFYVDNDVMICQKRLSWLQTRTAPNVFAVRRGGLAQHFVARLVCLASPRRLLAHDPSGTRHR